MRRSTSSGGPTAATGGVATGASTGMDHLEAGGQLPLVDGIDGSGFIAATPNTLLSGATSPTDDAATKGHGRRPSSRSFVAELLVHSCFSALCILAIVSGLRLERAQRFSAAQHQTVRARRTFEGGATAAHGGGSEVVAGSRSSSSSSSSSPSLPRHRPHGTTIETDEYSTLAEDELEAIVTRGRRVVSAMRRDGRIADTADADARAAVAALQNATLRLLHARYGPGPAYRVALKLRFPRSMGERDARIVIETAPLRWMPHAVHVFLDACVTKRERVAEALQQHATTQHVETTDQRRAAERRTKPPSWRAAFHRNAGHVLQAFVTTTPDAAEGLAFQEYDARFPHAQYTLGFAGRPGGPEFYISTVDNSRNHGPGSQGSTRGEADSCFARVVEGFDVVSEMRRQPVDETRRGLGFVSNPDDFIGITVVDFLGPVTGSAGDAASTTAMTPR